MINVDDRFGSWSQLSAAYNNCLRDTGFLGVFEGLGQSLGNELVEYIGGPVPALHPAYVLDSTNGQQIIKALLTRAPGTTIINFAENPGLHHGDVVTDNATASGTAVIIRRDFINSDNYSMAAWTNDLGTNPSQYDVTFRLKIAEKPPTGLVARIYVGKSFTKPDWSIMASQELTTANFTQAGQYQDFTLTFNLESQATDIQCRIDYGEGVTDLYIDTVTATNKGETLPVFAPIFIGLCTTPQRLTEVPQFAEDFKLAGGIVLTPDEFMAALNPEFMIGLASPLLGSDHPAIVEAKQQLSNGKYMNALLTIRGALRSLSKHS